MGSKILIAVFVMCSTFTFTFSQELSLDLLHAEAYYNLQEYDSTIVYADKVTDKDIIYRAIELRALSKFESKKYDDALVDFLKLNNIYKTKNSIYIAEIYAYNKNWEEASVWLTKHLKSEYKKNPGAIKIDGFFVDFSATKEWDEIWMQEWYTDIEVKIAEAEYLAYKEKYTRALEVSDEVLEMNKDCHKIYFLRSRIYKLIDDIKNRVYSLKMATKIAPNNEKYVTAYAKALLDDKKYKKSLEQFEKAITLDKYNPELYYYLALTYYRYNDYDNAIKYIVYYRQISPKDGDGIWLAGYIYKDNEDYEKAIDEFDEGIYLRLGRVGYLVGKGECLYNLQKYGLAANSFTQALDLSPNDGKIYYERGRAHFERGDRVNACKDWTKAGELGYFQADDLKLLNCQ